MSHCVTNHPRTSCLTAIMVCLTLRSVVWEGIGREGLFLPHVVASGTMSRAGGSLTPVAVSGY